MWGNDASLHQVTPIFADVISRPDHPLPLEGRAPPLPEEGPDQRREATIELCTRRCLRLGTRFAQPDVRVYEVKVPES